MSPARDLPRNGLYLLAFLMCLLIAFSAHAQDPSASTTSQTSISVPDPAPTEQVPVTAETTEVSEAPANTAESVIPNNSSSAPPMSEPTAEPEIANTASGQAPQEAPITSASQPNAANAANAAASLAGTTASQGAETAPPPESKDLFNGDRVNVLVFVAILVGLVAFFTVSAQKGKNLFIRRISGLSAIDEAVGRSTEMGRGVLFVPGIMDMDDIQTIAGVTILGHVAKKTAEYDTPLFAPMTRSFVMSVAQEVVQQSYLELGKRDNFRADRINYLTDDQFGYVAGVGGLMVREKPAACFYLGTFYAESLILAETGHSVGAIQIAGTAEPSQIPFFVTACDYTLIGEELFAASAYISRNPREVGSLKGQDMGKLLIIIMIVMGTLLMSISQSEWGEKSEAMKKATKTFMGLLMAK